MLAWARYKIVSISYTTSFFPFHITDVVLVNDKGQNSLALVFLQEFPSNNYSAYFHNNLYPQILLSFFFLIHSS